MWRRFHSSPSDTARRSAHRRRSRAWPARLRIDGSPAGFTLIELLVVVAIVAVAAAIALPLLTGRQTEMPENCQRNLRQLALGWMMYSTDNADDLVANRPYAGRPGILTDSWVAGEMDWSADPQNTNQALLLLAGLSPYLKSPALYHCPADKSAAAAGPRVRSYSMNAFMGATGEGPAVRGWKQHLKMADLRNPAGTFVFADEHPNSIDDGCFLNNPNRTNTWIDIPGSGHNGAGGFAFADGHVETHRWVDSSTIQRMIPGGPRPSVQPGRGEGADLAWILAATTRRETEPASEP